MFVFDVTGVAGARAEIRVQALDWGQSGPVTFRCDDDQLAVLLLTDCRCDAVGFFNLLAGCKPLYLEQWLSYLQETYASPSRAASWRARPRRITSPRPVLNTKSSMLCSGRSIR